MQKLLSTILNPGASVRRLMCSMCDTLRRCMCDALCSCKCDALCFRMRDALCARRCNHVAWCMLMYHDVWSCYMIDENCTWSMETTTLTSRHAKVEQTQLNGFVKSASVLRRLKHMKPLEYENTCDDMNSLWSSLTIDHWYWSSIMASYHRSLIVIIDHW